MTNARTVRSTREKAAQLRAEAARREARRRSIWISIAVAVVLVIAVAVTVVVRQAQHQQAVAGASTPGGVPAHVLPDGGILGVSGPAPAGKTPVTVTMWEDFQCPACRAFETGNHAQLEAWARQGIVRLVYQPVAFLDRASTTNYSTRALIAAGAVENVRPSAFQAFHDLLYTHQPDEGSVGLTDAQLVDLAAQAGAPRDAVAKALSTQQYKGWTVKRTETFSAEYSSTPTVLVNGKVVTAGDPTYVISPSGLKSIVASAAAAQGLPAPK